jgi:hypothetical protein
MDPPDIEREVRTFILPAPANAGYGRKHRDPSKLPGERQRREAPYPRLSAIPREVQAFTLASARASGMSRPCFQRLGRSVGSV